ncbi:hypothetical protein F0919_05895 [Taibaiella lutea]|uniref:Outer membrane protein beta-barrel domain-containing protein n=1 Tax=Taibaiella lutea TaxID=2608001 RepID=A0A5M6CQE5_9BACT|nr:hypothetical protein [Taibaiella lutea]KAA5537203.1 hypothetical protein F0919_05895 [Taibaiella lutea]
MRKICLQIILCCFFSIKLQATVLPYESTPFFGDYQWIPAIKLGYTGGLGLDNKFRNGLEVGFHYCRDGNLFLQGPSATVTFAYENRQFRIIPKVGYEVSLVFLTGKADFWLMGGELYFTPSAGITAIRKDVHLMVGYNTCLKDDAKSGIHFSAYINLRLKKLDMHNRRD